MYDIIIIMGEAGTGKDTICKNLCLAYPNIFHRVISHTTRPRRENETEGSDYYFIKQEEWDQYRFIEETKFNNWYYGTNFEALDSNKINVAVMNPAGVLSFLKSKDINIIKIIKLEVPAKIRIERQLKREENPNVSEICRRFLADENDFTNFDFKKYNVEIKDNITAIDKFNLISQILNELEGKVI